MIFIVFYPILFNVVGVIVTANRIEDTRRISTGQGPNFGLWLAHAIADPTRTLLPAVFFLLQFLIPTARKMVMQSRLGPHPEEARSLTKSNGKGTHLLYSEEDA